MPSPLVRKTGILSGLSVNMTCCYVGMKQDCTHWLCVDCSRKIIWYDESWWGIDPCKYGCPPCPNGCKNPPRGKQCLCDEYDPVKEKWYACHPWSYKRWCDAEDRSVEHGLSNEGAFYCSRTCPMCRRKM